jgi:4'-phosphopantetheinyl transferase
MPDRIVEWWLVDLDACAPALQAIERAIPRLSPDDRRRAAALADPREAARRRAAYTALRIAIERLAGPAVRAQPFTRDDSGKPTLPLSGVAFSLAHTNELALIGVTRLATIGIDLERMRPIRMSLRHIDDIRAAGAGLGREPLPGGTEHAFLQAWARIEAFTKARGHTLLHTLAGLGLRNRPQRPPSPAETQSTARRLARTANLHVTDIKLPLDLHGAVAVPRALLAARVRMFPADQSELANLLRFT